MSADPFGPPTAPLPDEGMHRHAHEHGDGTHDHVHHHTSEAHEHGHGGRLTVLASGVSLVHALDPRSKILGALIVILGVVLTPPLRGTEFLLVSSMLLCTAIIGRLPIGWLLARTALVLPIAGTIALFAPLARSGGPLSTSGMVGAYAAGGWVAAWSILSKAWLSVLVMLVLSGTTEVPKLIRGLEALKVPDVFIALFSFIHRYADVFGSQVRSLGRAVDSRAPALGRLRRWRLYGNLAGNMLVRAYDRGERIHAAMLSRGFDGTLPTAAVLRFAVGDALVILIALLSSAAVALY